MGSSVSIGSAIAAMSIATLACDRPGLDVFSSPSAPTLHSASVVLTDDAIARITNAACGRARGCGDVGRDRRFSDETVCKSVVARSTEADIGRAACPSGVSEHSLNRCLAEVRGDICGIDRARPTALFACQRQTLCGAAQ